MSRGSATPNRGAPGCFVSPTSRIFFVTMPGKGAAIRNFAVRSASAAEEARAAVTLARRDSISRSIARRVASPMAAIPAPPPPPRPSAHLRGYRRIAPGLHRSGGDGRDDLLDRLPPRPENVDGGLGPGMEEVRCG